MGWIRCIRCKKLQRDFMARTFALIAPVHPVLHPVSCSYEMIPNAPKHFAMHQKMSFLSNGVDQVRSLRKNTMWIRGTNFCINCTNSPRFAPSFMQLRNNPKCTQTLWNAPEHEFRVQWGGSSAFVAKSYNVSSWQKLLHLLHQFTPFCTKFHAVMKRFQMHRNTMQHTNGVDWLRS